MISYHTGRPPATKEEKRSAAPRFTYGFKTVDTNEPERIARGVVKHVVAPGIFRDGHRTQGNFLFADWIGLDFDDGELTLDQAVNNVFCDMVHVIGVTMSHQTAPEFRDKFRVLIPLERRVESLALYRHQLRIGMRKWPCDEKCKDGARLFYPCREIVSVSTEGYSWEVDEDVPPETDYSSLTVARVKHGVIPGWVRQKLHSQWEAHTYNDTCFKLGCALGVHGYSPDEIVAMILNGPTYQGKTAPKKEIFDSVESGVKRGLEDLHENNK